MKKFMKYGIIAGGVLILAGAGITTASLLLGADMGDLRGHIGRKLHRLDELDGIVDPEEFLVHGERHYVSVEHETVRAEGQAPEAVPSADASAGEGPWQSPGTDGGFEAGYPHVTDLKIRQQGGNVEIFRMDEISSLTVKSGSGSLDALSFREYGMDSVLALRAGAGEDYQIFIPGSWVLDEFEAEILEGTLEGTGVRALEAELSVSEGSASFAQEDGRKADLECLGGGTILWTMETERYMEIDAECRNGSITLSVPETMDPDGIGYDIECKNGTVEFPGFTVEGNQKKEAAGSRSVMELEAVSGTISVQHTAGPQPGDR